MFVSLQACGANNEVENIRETVWRLQNAYNSAAGGEEQRVAIRAEAIGALQRYMHLILVAAYLRECAPELEKTYSEWSKEKEVQDLFDEVGSATEGPLSTFNWE